MYVVECNHRPWQLTMPNPKWHTLDTRANDTKKKVAIFNYELLHNNIAIDAVDMYICVSIVLQSVPSLSTYLLPTAMSCRRIEPAAEAHYSKWLKIYEVYIYIVCFHSYLYGNCLNTLFFSSRILSAEHSHYLVRCAHFFVNWLDTIPNTAGRGGTQCNQLYSTAIQ